MFIKHKALRHEVLRYGASLLASLLLTIAAICYYLRGFIRISTAVSSVLLYVFLFAVGCLWVTRDAWISVKKSTALGVFLDDLIFFIQNRIAFGSYFYLGIIAVLPIITLGVIVFSGAYEFTLLLLALCGVLFATTSFLRLRKIVEGDAGIQTYLKNLLDGK